ncbi:hypothetical protein [Borreliella bavariensis]|uniref:hypothetical protein n=1 Tax=Borreliella bavariensis TaxID=664662 RepID=UPI001C026987|nr:hypothetical protein [Borreliella bavariensis]
MKKIICFTVVRINFQTKFISYFFIPMMILFQSCFLLSLLFEEEPVKSITEDYKLKEKLTKKDLSEEEYKYYKGNISELYKFHLDEFAKEYRHNMYYTDLYLFEKQTVIRILQNHELVTKDFNKHGYIFLRYRNMDYIDHIPVYDLVKVDNQSIKQYKLQQESLEIIENKVKKKKMEYEKSHGRVKNNPFSIQSIRYSFEEKGDIKNNDIIYFEGYFYEIKALNLKFRNNPLSRDLSGGVAFKVKNHESKDIKNIINKLTKNTQYLLKLKFFEVQEGIINIEIIEIYGPDENGKLTLINRYY